MEHRGHPVTIWDSEVAGASGTLAQLGLHLELCRYATIRVFGDAADAINLGSL